MKKVFVFMLIALISVGSIFASTGAQKKDSFSIGLNLGTDNGVIMNYGMGKFDLEGIVGFGVIYDGLNVEVAANYQIVDIAKEADFSGYMPFTVGGEVMLSTNFDNFGMGFLVPLKLAYTFEKTPVTLYFRFAPGIYVPIVPDPDVKFGVQASIGATYNF